MRDWRHIGVYRSVSIWMMIYAFVDYAVFEGVPLCNICEGKGFHFPPALGGHPPWLLLGPPQLGLPSLWLWRTCRFSVKVLYMW